jgi:hypothetical protein
MNRTTSVVISLRFKHAVSLRLDPVGSSAGVLVPEPLPFAFIRSVVTKWLVFGHSSLVTFFCASRRKLLGSRAETRRAATHLQKSFAEATKERAIAKPIS